MYTEKNNYNVYQNNFTFSINKWINEVNIDCTSNWVLYPLSDVWQGIGCAWTGTTVTTTFEVFENTNLILEDYLNNNIVSFWTITITEITTTNNNLFSNEQNIKEFYIYQSWIIVVVIVFIFILKFNKKILWRV
jgi:hypothetical protein